MVGRLLGGRQARRRPCVQPEAGPQEVNAVTSAGEVMAQHHPSPSASFPRKATATAVTSLLATTPRQPDSCAGTPFYAVNPPSIVRLAPAGYPPLSERPEIA